MPGNPVSAIATQTAQGLTDATAIQKVYTEYAESFGVNKPIYQQFFIWIVNLFRGDFGVSFSQYPRKVGDIINSSIWWTIALQLPAIIVG